MNQSQSGVRVFLSQVWEKIVKVSGSKMDVSESNIAEYKMAAIIKLSLLEWMSEVLLCANGGNQSWQVWVNLRGNTKMAESKMAKFMMVGF